MVLIRAILGLLLLAGAAMPGALAQTIVGPELGRQLSAGGYVILMRHASSPAERPGNGVAQPDNVTLERQLDEYGRRTAAAMGAAIRQLALPIDKVLSSPTYRTLETIRRAGLPEPVTFTELGDGGSQMSENAVTAYAPWLKMKVAEPPPPGTNTFIVSHAPNIAAAFADGAKGIAEGEALVFRPDGKGAAALVARIKIEEWPKLAAK